MAFNSLLNNMELIKRVYLNATNGNRVYPITKDELLYSSQIMSQITPLEVDILFKLASVIHQTGYVWECNVDASLGLLLTKQNGWI